jgi:hypothetical protein
MSKASSHDSDSGHVEMDPVDVEKVQSQTQAQEPKYPSGSRLALIILAVYLVIFISALVRSSHLHPIPY